MSSPEGPSRRRFALSGSLSLTVDGEPFALFGADQLVELRVRDGRLEIVDVLRGEVFAHYELDKEGKPIVPS